MRCINILLLVGFLLSEQELFSIFDSNCLRNCCLWSFWLKKRKTKPKGNGIDAELVIPSAKDLQVLHCTLQNTPQIDVNNPKLPVGAVSSHVESTYSVVSQYVLVAPPNTEQVFTELGSNHSSQEWYDVAGADAETAIVSPTHELKKQK